MLAYDVFGNGKTAVKMNLGRYLEGVGVQLNYANTNPTLRIPTSTGPFGVPGVTQDVDRRERGSRRPTATCPIRSANGNPAAVNGGGGADFCGQISNTCGLASRC